MCVCVCVFVCTNVHTYTGMHTAHMWRKSEDNFQESAPSLVTRIKARLSGLAASSFILLVYSLRFLNIKKGNLYSLTNLKYLKVSINKSYCFCFKIGSAM